MEPIDLNRIREARQQKRVSQAKLAQAIGVTPSQVSRFESGKRRIHLDEARKIADVLGLDLAEILRANVAPAWKQGGITTSLLTLPEGRAIVEYPGNLSPESRMAVKDWLELVAKLAVRR